MRNLSILALSLALLVVQSTMFPAFMAATFQPQLLVPVVIYLGVSHEVRIVRGAGLSFLAGYLLDIFCGSPMGLQTFVLVATFLVARAARFRLLLRGPFFQMSLAFTVSLAAGAVVLAVRTVFEKSSVIPVPTMWIPVKLLLGSAFATALFAPPLVLMLRRIDSPGTVPA